jgi:NAD(P)-dependent dehydrogenase (short-subunit alcohol dehydrogenase family)
MPADFDFKGKAVLVTGAGSGLGRATALRMGSLGAELSLVDVNAENLERVAEEIRSGGGSAVIQTLDLAERSNCALAVDNAVERFGRLNVLCNIAGIAAADHFTDVTPERFDRVMAVNLAAPFFLAQRAVPHLLETSGTIVNCCSSAAYIAHAYMTVYAASKAAMVSLTKSLAIEYGRKPLRVCGVAPAGMMTNLTATLKFPEDADWTLIQRFSGLREMTPVEEVAEMITWMASDRGGPFHGVVVQMDAGSTAG